MLIMETRKYYNSARACPIEFRRKTSCSKFWPKDIHWEQKITNWSLTTFKGKISVFIVVFCTLHGSVTLFRTIKTLDNFGSLTFKTFFRDI